MRHVIAARTKKLDGYFERAADKAVSDEMQSDLARFGAVLVCGFIEQSVAVVVLSRLEAKAHPRVLKFVKAHFNKGANYDCPRICELLERFDLQWSTNFRAFIDRNEKLASQVDSVYALRNSIAHGGTANHGLRGVKELYLGAQEVIKGLIEATA